MTEEERQGTITALLDAAQESKRAAETAHTKIRAAELRGRADGLEYAARVLGWNGRR